MSGNGRRRGRVKGSKNLIPAMIQEKILEALKRAGDVDYLTNLAKTEPQIFCSLLAKIIPKQIDMPENSALQIKIIRFGKNAEDLL